MTDIIKQSSEYRDADAADSKDRAMQVLRQSIDTRNPSNFDESRRHVLGAGLAGFVGVAAMSPLSALAASGASATRRVSFRNAHTGDSFSGTYRVGDRYLPEAFERINYVLRDFRTGEVFPMDPKLMDILALVQKKNGSRSAFDILSGYRSPKTNSMLRTRGKTTGVAKNSFHMYGQAMDIQLPGTSPASVRKAAISLRAGGVGYYPKSKFVHVDTGNVRSW
jgi:uncharacterized protein YcbK (DUF882 family)